MKALFIELPPFSRSRNIYLSEEVFQELQLEMLKNPLAGEVIIGTGGLRKLRYGDFMRGKGKRGGLRVIYFWLDAKKQFWLFTLYDKDEFADLTQKDKAALKSQLKLELEARL